MKGENLVRALLILGVHGHGRVVVEMDTSHGYMVHYLDDNTGQNAVGKKKLVLL